MKKELFHKNPFHIHLSLYAKCWLLVQTHKLKSWTKSNQVTEDSLCASEVQQIQLKLNSIWTFFPVYKNMVQFLKFGLKQLSTSTANGNPFLTAKISFENPPRSTAANSKQITLTKKVTTIENLNKKPILLNQLEKLLESSSGHQNANVSSGFRGTNWKRTSYRIQRRPQISIFYVWHQKAVIDFHKKHEL